MNGHSEPSMTVQQQERQLRRQRRRQARLGNAEATEESSDEISHIGADRRAPREPIERLIPVLNLLRSYNSDVDQIERALGNLLQKDERIQSLSVTVKELQNFKSEESRMVEEERRQLEDLQSQLDDEKTSLDQLRQTLDQESAVLKGEKRQFKADVMAKYEKAIATETKRLADESQKRTEQIEKATAAKSEQAEQNIRQLQDQVSSLTEAKDDAVRALKLFNNRTKELEGQVNELESKYKTQDSPLPELEEDLSKIHKALKAIAHAYFGELTLDDSDTDQSQRLRDNNPIFAFVPLTGSVTSKYLRVRAAQSVIAKVICHSLWQPFGGSILGLSPDQISAFVQISEALARQDRRKESLWRYLTFEGLDLASVHFTRDSGVNSQLSLLETQHLSDVLRVLIPQPKHKDFERDLGQLLTECVQFWNKAQRDSCIVEFDTKPPELCSSGWLSEPCPDLDRVDGSTEQGSTEVQAWCLFPRVVFKPVNEEPIILAGSAVFSDCPAFHEGSREIKQRKEQLAQFMRQSARQLPVSKGR